MKRVLCPIWISKVNLNINSSCGILRNDLYVIYETISLAKKLFRMRSFHLFAYENSGKMILFFWVKSVVNFENYRLQRSSINFNIILYHFYMPDALKCVFISISLIKNHFFEFCIFIIIGIIFNIFMILSNSLP